MEQWGTHRAPHTCMEASGRQTLSPGSWLSEAEWEPACYQDRGTFTPGQKSTSACGARHPPSPLKPIPEPVPASPQTMALGLWFAPASLTSLALAACTGSCSLTEWSPRWLEHPEAAVWSKFRGILPLSPATPSPSGKGTLLGHSQNNNYRIKVHQIIFKVPFNLEIL